MCVCYVHTTSDRILVLRTWKTERNMRAQIMNMSAHINTGITSFNFMPYYTYQKFWLHTFEPPGVLHI